MPRVIVLALFVVVAVAMTACGKADKNEVPANSPAGKVVEMSGRVAATRNGAARTLAVASEIFRDDLIETSADGAVTIELFHNNARWSVDAAQKKRVDESVAWGLDKQDGVTKPLEHATSAAGRNGERTAGDTTTTVREKNGALQQDRGGEPPPSAGSAQVAESKPVQAPSVQPSPAVSGGAPGGAAAPPVTPTTPETSVAPPPPPPPPPPGPAAPKDSRPRPKSGAPEDNALPRGIGELGDDGQNAQKGPPKDPKVDTSKKVSVDAVKSLALLRNQLRELAACKGAAGGRLVVRLAAGVPTTISVEGATADLPCIRAIVTKIVFPKADLDLQLGLSGG